jgi:hypothetical protein
VEKKTSELDPRAKVKKAFRSSVIAIRKELTEVLGAFSHLDDDTADFIHELPLTAASMWLEMGTQRCRLFVVMLGSEIGSVKDRVHHLNEDHELDLNLKPELLKYGDAKGQQLETKATLCEGSTATLSLEN